MYSYSIFSCFFIVGFFNSRSFKVIKIINLFVFVLFFLRGRGDLKVKVCSLLAQWMFWMEHLVTKMSRVGYIQNWIDFFLNSQSHFCTPVLSSEWIEEWIQKVNSNLKWSLKEKYLKNYFIPFWHVLVMSLNRNFTIIRASKVYDIRKCSSMVLLCRSFVPLLCWVSFYFWPSLLQLS